ncbi:MAG: hypothetical protein ACD_15C00075G0010 [uncultured bacterium]|nr:MAG: hypothetical protein ACD_15C00075G0010 [uncultured bacterium]
MILCLQVNKHYESIFYEVRREFEIYIYDFFCNCDCDFFIFVFCTGDQCILAILKVKESESL